MPAGDWMHTMDNCNRYAARQRKNHKLTEDVAGIYIDFTESFEQVMRRLDGNFETKQ